MARVSRSAKARAMRVARQQRQGEHHPLSCERCGANVHDFGLSLVGAALLCSDCGQEGPWSDLDLP